MYFTKVRWFNIIAPLVAFAATILIVPAAHAAIYTADIKGSPDSYTWTDGTAYVHASGDMGYVQWSTNVASTTGACTVANFPKPPSNYWTGNMGGKQTGGITQKITYLLECFVDGYLVASDSVNFEIGAQPVQTVPYTVSFTPYNSFQTAVAGSVGVQLSQFKFSNNASENILLKQIAFTNFTLGASQLVGGSVTIWNGSTQVGSVYMGTSTGAVATLVTPVVIPAYDAVTLSLRADLLPQGIGQSTTPGAVVSIGYDGSKQGVGGNYATGANTGALFTGSTEALNPPGTKIYRTVPTVTDVSSPTSTLVAGSDLTKIKITASPSRDILLRRITFDVVPAPCTVVSNFVLYGPMGRVHALDQQISNGRLTITFDNTNADRLIPAGTAKTYTLRAMSVSGVTATDGGLVSIRFRNDDAFPFTTMGTVNHWEYVAGTTSNNFIWSPNSTTTPEATLAKNFNMDWANALGVSGYPYVGAHFPYKTYGVGSGTCVPQLHMTAPVGGERMMIYATPLTIKWTPDETSTSVAAYLDTQINGQYTQVGKIIEAGRGSIVWAGDVNQYDSPATPGEYFIRIVDTKSGAWDRSDGPITVLPADYYTADLKIAGTDGPIVGYASTSIASWTSQNVNVCGLSDQYGNSPLKSALSSPGSTPITIELNDTAVEQRFALNCSGALGTRGDVLTILPVPYPTELQDELTAYGNMKRFFRRSQHEFAILGDINWAAAEMTAFVGTANGSMRIALSTSTAAYELNNQIVQVGIQLANELNAGTATNANELYALLHGLLTQLRLALDVVPSVCSDGIDNDGDAKIDYPADPGCSSSSDNDEYNVPISYGANIVTNPGFESAKNNWSGWGTKTKLVTTEKHSGTYGMEFVHTTSGTRTLNNGTTYAVVPGSKVLASAYVKAVGAGTADTYLELEWRNASGSILKRDQVAYTGGATAWTKIEKTLTVPANATKLKVRLKDSATPSVGSVFFDEVSVQLSETVTASERLFSRILSNVLTAVQAVSASR